MLVSAWHKCWPVKSVPFILHSSKMCHSVTLVAVPRSPKLSLANESQIFKTALLNSTWKVKLSPTKKPLVCFLRQTAYLTFKFTQIPTEAFVESFNHFTFKHSRVVCDGFHLSQRWANPPTSGPQWVLKYEQESRVDQEHMARVFWFTSLEKKRICSLNV